MSDLEESLNKDKIPKEDLLSKIERNKDFLARAYEVRSCLKIILIFLTTGVTESNSEDIKEALEKDENLLFATTANQLDEKIHKIIEKIKVAPKVKLQEFGLKISESIIDMRNITSGRHNNAIRENIVETIDRIKTIDHEGQTFFIEGDKLYIEETA